METLLSPPALARHLGVAEQTVYRWIRAGRIPPPSVSLGGTRGYALSEVSEIEDWHERKRRAAEARVRLPFMIESTTSVRSP